MKNIIKSIIVLLAFFAVSCTISDVQDRPVIVEQDAPILTAPVNSTSYILAKENASNQVERFTWSSANFGGDVAVTYNVELVVKGGDFKKSQILATRISENQAAVTVETLNNAALQTGSDINVPVEYEIRIKANAGNLEMYSNKIGVTITSYPAYDDWGIVGNATPGDWNNSTPMNYNSTTKTYSITIDLVEGSMKFRKDNKWDVNYGDNGNDLTLDAGGDNIPIKEAGNYTITADFNAKTYTIKKN